MTSRIAALIIGLLLWGGGALGQDGSFISIGTGSVTGVYYPAGGAICRVVNRDRLDHGVRCGVVATSGSVANLDGLRDGTFDFAVAQSDLAYAAATGTGPFAGAAPFEGLLTVFALYPEPFTVVARADAGISDLEDLRDKRVNIGEEGSGARATMEVVMDALGWTARDFSEVFELGTAEQAGAFCEGRIDAIVYSVGHPSSAVQQVTSACGGVLVPVEGPEIDALVAETPYYRTATIPGGLYRGNDEDIASFGVGAIVVTRDNVPENLVHLVVQSVFENLDQIRATHPAFSALDARVMATAEPGLGLHPGAERYFEEAGLSD
jgi:TRAP transporter TAXI family solute receptor